MNLNDKNIDQIFRDAAQNSDAPRYDHSYWKEMSSVLNDQDKRKRGFILWSVAGSIIALFLVSTLFITNNNKSETQLAKNDQTFTQTNEWADEGVQTDKDISQQSTATKSEVKTASNVVSNNLGALENKSNIAKGSSISEKEVLASNKELQSVANNYSVENIKENQLNNSKMNQLKKGSIESEVSPVALNSTKNTPELNDIAVIQELPPKTIAMQRLEASNELLPIQLFKDSPIHFYAKLSAGLMENYETSRPFQSGIFDLSLNLEYSKEQVLFRTGVGFQATSNADLVVSERAKVYGFGITTHQNNLSYQSLYDIYVPLELGYKLNNTSLGFGAQVNYMLRTTMNYESLENKVVVDEYKIKGFAEGLNAITAQGYVWLEQKLTDRISAGVKVGTNLNSRIKEGKYFNESATTNPLYGQLTLRYNITK